ncbi:MAG: prepilin-type N-terminal cleavage/methylation domain-containing protein [Deltaproteobacteria bacterium]|nr:prepilin-type N-terminal cleavage/methylation domain-containing protein [Deltaproteobacteria bacterium]
MNQKGFSLIEIMIGVAILAGMTILIQTTMSRALDARNKAERRDELFHSVRISLGKLNDDLAQAFLANSAFKGQEGNYATGMIGSDQALDFSTFSRLHFQKNAHDSDAASVGYSLKANDAGTSDLYRRESQWLGEKVTEGGIAYAMIENVKELKIQYYDSNKTEWVAEWDTTQLSTLNRLPQAVKVELRVVFKENEEDEEEAGKEYFFTTTMPVNLYANEINF